MARRLRVRLPDALQTFVDRRAILTTPGDYIRGLIREDMERVAIHQSVLRRLGEAEQGELHAIDISTDRK